MAESAFIVEVPEAESHVSELRKRFDPSFALGVSAHITVLVPFMSPERITAAVLDQAERALSNFESFSFALREVRRFPATTYLAPEPPEPFVALTEGLVKVFPAYPSFAGEFESIIPHLTVAHGNVAEAEFAQSALANVMQTRGPIACTCATVILIENSSGMWRTMHRFVLPERQTGA